MTELTINQVDVAKLNIQPGEILLVTPKQPLTAETAARIRDTFNEAFKRSGGGVPPTVIVGDPNLDVSVVKSSADELREIIVRTIKEQVDIGSLRHPLTRR